MKDSGVEWIGDIPENWEVRKLRNIGKFTSSGIDKKIEEGQPLVKIINYTDVYGNSSNILNNKDYMVVSADANRIKEHLVKEGDLIFTPSSETVEDIGISALVNEPLENTAYSYHVLRFRPIIEISKQYKKYLCNNHYVLNYFSSRASGTIRQTLSRRDFNECYVLLPPLSEQQKIAEFLDDKCGAIDEIISKTEQSIEEYKKLKQSVITKAVTKGIRPNRPMQDSNIEWIGEIPQDWEIKKFRNILKERTEKNVPIKSTERLSLSIDLGVTLYAEKTTNLDRFKDDFEQYKIAHEGDLVMNSMNMIIGAVGVSKYYGCVSPVYYTWYDETPNHTTAKYCEYLLRCKTIKKVLFALGRGIYAIERGDDRVNTCRLKISRDDLKNLKLPLPSLDEQAEIINYLDEKCAEIDTLIEKKQQFLAEMANYKKSLIYEYVIGKKEVA